MKRDVIYGAIGGIATVVFSLSVWAISPETLVSSLVFWISTAILVLFVILAMLHKKSGTSEAADFKSLLKTGFVVYIIGDLVAYFFLYLMFNYIDPGLIDIQRQQAIEFWLERNGGNADAADVVRAKEYDYAMTLGRAIFGYARGLIFGFLVSTVLAMMMKEKPYFDEGN